MTRRFHPGARTDLIDAQRWYESKQKGLGRRFRRVIEHGVDRIVALPLAAPLWPDIDADFGVRRYVLRGFPYSIAYMLRDGAVIILAVAHQSRHPDYWRDRIE